MTGYMRLWNPDWYSAAISESEIRKKDVHRHYPMTFEIRYTAEASATATEIGAAADNALDGTTTPVLVYIDAAADTDKDATDGHVRKVRLIGLSVASATDYINGKENEVYSVEEVNLTAAGGTTAVVTTRYYLRVIHLYASDWGSGGTDASNAIYCQDDAAGTTKYLTIAQNFNESNNGGLIYVAESYYGRWKRLLGNLNDPIIRDAAPDQGGLISAVKSGFNDILNTDPDHTGSGYIFNWYHPVIDIEPEIFRSKGTTTASITFKEQRAGDKAEVIQIQILYEIQTSA